MAEVLLKIEGIHKRFGGLHALNNVALTINKGEIYGLIGPNGAGKTTLFNVLTGLYVPDEGAFEFDGHNLFQQKPHVVVAAGIARTFQNIRLFAEMTALENVMVGRHIRSKAGALGAVLRDRRTMAEERLSPTRRGSCWSMSASPMSLMSAPATCPMAISAVWKSPARWPPSPSCWRWTSRLPA